MLRRKKRPGGTNLESLVENQFWILWKQELDLPCYIPNYLTILAVHPVVSDVLVDRSGLSLPAPIRLAVR